jgi:hypothetical protein
MRTESTDALSWLSNPPVSPHSECRPSGPRRVEAELKIRDKTSQSVRNATSEQQTGGKRTGGKRWGQNESCRCAGGFDRAMQIGVNHRHRGGHFCKCLNFLKLYLCKESIHRYKKRWKTTKTSGEWRQVGGRIYKVESNKRAKMLKREARPGGGGGVLLTKGKEWTLLGIVLLRVAGKRESLH